MRIKVVLASSAPGSSVLFSLPVLLANSLVPVQVIHAGIDLMNGLILSQAAESSLGAPAQQSGA